MRQSLFLTGATGYLGSRLLPRADLQRYDQVFCLVRRGSAIASTIGNRPNVKMVCGDLLCPASYSDQLAECDAAVHLAAVTGKAKPADYFRVNTEATRVLLEEAKSRGVQSFLYISTIAAKFPDQTRYFYAHSKQQAEELVAASGMAFTILRPTMIIGPGAPVLEGLAKLAGVPVMPVFGDGMATVEPVFVDDLVNCILEVLRQKRFAGETIEIGGPETMTIEELLCRIRLIRLQKPPRAIHLPLRPTRALLGLLERVLLPLLPITAGQLATFANHGVSAPHVFRDELPDSMKGVDNVLKMKAFDDQM